MPGSEHPNYCKNESELGKLRADVDTLKGAVMGNDGLIVIVPKLAQNVSTLNDTAGMLATAVSGLVKFQEGQVGQERGKEKIKSRNRWIVGMVIAALTLVSGILAGIHFGS